MSRAFGFDYRRCCPRKPGIDFVQSRECLPATERLLLKEYPMNIRFVFPFLMQLLLASSGLAQGPISNFQHVIVIVQENRTPDDLFQGLCLPPYGNPKACGSG